MDAGFLAKWVISKYWILLIRIKKNCNDNFAGIYLFFNLKKITIHAYFGTDLRILVLNKTKVLFKQMQKKKKSKNLQQKN